MVARKSNSAPSGDLTQTSMLILEPTPDPVQTPAFRNIPTCLPDFPKPLDPKGKLLFCCYSRVWPNVWRARTLLFSHPAEDLSFNNTSSSAEDRLRVVMRLLIVAVLLSTPSLAAAEVDSVSISQLLNEIPTCGSQCYHSALGSSADDSLSPVSDFCYEEGYWGKIRSCILLQCSTLDQFKLNKVQSKVCDQPTQNREKQFYAIFAAEIPAWISPWLRFLISWRSADGLHLDDYVMFACGIIYTVYVTCIHYVHHTIFDTNSSKVDSDDMSSGLEILFIADKFALVCIALAKIAIVYINLRKFPGTRVRVIAFTTLALIIVPTLVLLFVFIFQCSPISFAWEGWTNGPSPHKCLNPQIISYVKLAFDIGQSIVLMVLPLPFLYQLSMDFRAKLGTAVIFVMGSLALAMAGLRLRFLVLQGSKPNQPWEYSDQLIWTGVEISALIIIACLPSIWKLFPAPYKRKPAVLTRRNRSNRYLRDKPLPPIRTKSNAFVSLDNSQKKSVYKAAKSTMTESQRELDLHLGDKARGDVWTQIKGGRRFSSFSILSHMSGRLGIRVKTTTTTRVDVEESENDECGIVSPRTGPLSP